MACPLQVGAGDVTGCISSYALWVEPWSGRILIIIEYFVTGINKTYFWVLKSLQFILTYLGVGTLEFFAWEGLRGGYSIVASGRGPRCSSGRRLSWVKGGGDPLQRCFHKPYVLLVEMYLGP